jgi:hypothetical protein
MPGSRGDSEFAGLTRKALMDRAKELGIPSRKGQGKAGTRRSMISVQRNCEQNITGLSSSSQNIPGASSSLQSPLAALHSYANHEDVSITDEATIIKTGKQKKRNHAKWDANRKSTDKRMQSRYKNGKKPMQRGKTARNGFNREL